MTTVYEQLGREKKAGKLLITLLSARISAETARAMDATHWALAAKAAGVNHPSAGTIAIVLRDLQRYEKGRAA